ncbi:cadherin-like beta sandwich domain-containing protein [Eubacteriaceae bacterium ES3]|nr:cadherin-like beta sandwich domain-containing protein [Eubacteriaceae bacterium ES3]
MEKSIRIIPKCLLIVIGLLMIVGLSPQTALAATHTVSDGQTFDISSCGAGDLVVVEEDATARLTGSKNVLISCKENVTLTLDSVTINSYIYALIFTGSSNTLILSGENKLISSDQYPGIRVEAGTELEIKGDGSLDVTGGRKAAGIGGGEYGDAGTITITGGTVIASGRGLAAGIDGGSNGDGGTTTITGGTVKATGAIYAAGIGGGDRGDGGTISITGGTVYAFHWVGENCDVGPGLGKSGGSLSIGGDALVFSANDSFLTPVKGHTHFPISGPLYGFSLPDDEDWTDAGFYARACSINYEDNGGTGVKNSILPVDGTTTVDDSSGFTNPGYTFIEWNSESDGSGTSYAPGDSITVSEDITLYAIWTADKTSMIGNISPADNDSPIDGNVVISFNNDMDTSVTGTVSINGTALSGGAWSNSGRTYTIPYSGLNYYQSCSIDISGFQDSYGTTMTADSASFTTEAPADLSSLAVNTGSLNPVFDPDTAAYSVDATGIDSIGITAQTLDPGATMTINGSLATSGSEASVDLDNGANMIAVVVTAQDGSQKSYILSVNGTVSDANLASLSLNTGSLSPAFDAGTTAYYANVGSDVDEITLTASASDEKAIMLLDGVILSHGALKTIPLSVGDNEIKLMVIAQDATTKTYTLTINRGDSDATLSGLTLSEGTLSPAFAKTTTAYTATVENAVDSLTVTPTSTDSGTDVTVNGNDASVPVNLSVGTNTITVVVTGSDGVTTRTYTIEVTRQDQITITNSSMPVGMVGITYNLSFESSAGLVPLPGLRLDCQAH